MRYLSLLLGMIKITWISFFSFGKIKIAFPVRYGKNVRLGCRKRGKIKLGRYVSLNSNAHLYATEDALLQIGNRSGIGDNNVIVAREKIMIGDNVMIGPNVCIYDHDHIINKEGTMRDSGFDTAPVIIEDNVWIAAGVIILKGVTIGTGSVIAAGTLINKDVAPNVVVYNKRETVVKDRGQGNRG